MRYCVPILQITNIQVYKFYNLLIFQIMNIYNYLNFIFHIMEQHQAIASGESLATQSPSNDHSLAYV